MGYKKQLEGVVKKKAAAAIDQRDHPTVVRFIRLYPLLGIEEEGLQVPISLSILIPFYFCVLFVCLFVRVFSFVQYDWSDMGNNIWWKFLKMDVSNNT